MVAILLFPPGSAIAGHEGLPRNADEIPMLMDEPASADVVRRAETFARSRFGGFERRIDALSRLAAEADVVAWHVDVRRPGKGWEALQPTNRAWLRIIGQLEPAILDALVHGRSAHEFLLEGSEATASLLFPDDRVEAGASVYIQRRRVWLPVPVLLLQAGTRSRNDVVEGPSIGFPPALVRILLGTRLRAWHGAGSFYHSMRTYRSCSATVHISPLISEVTSTSVVDGVCAQVAWISQWIGLVAEQTDVFVYAEGERELIGMPGWDVALPRFAQVHQGANSTLGHEVAHLLLYQAWGQQGSAWAGEGIATLLNGDYDAAERACEALPLEYDFGDLSEDFGYDDKAYYAAAFVADAVFGQFGYESVRGYYHSSSPSQYVAVLAGIVPERVGDTVGQWFIQRCTGDRHAPSRWLPPRPAVRGLDDGTEAPRFEHPSDPTL